VRFQDRDGKFCRLVYSVALGGSPGCITTGAVIEVGAIENYRHMYRKNRENKEQKANAENSTKADPLRRLFLEVDLDLSIWCFNFNLFI
jgi:hypothetical protein